MVLVLMAMKMRVELILLLLLLFYIFFPSLPLLPFQVVDLPKNNGVSNFGGGKKNSPVVKEQNCSIEQIRCVVLSLSLSSFLVVVVVSLS